MDEFNIELLRKLCNNGCVIWSVHSVERLQERGITINDVKSVIFNGEIIEHYPDSFPYPASLILGFSVKGKKLHVVCGCNGELIKIITAYYPTTDKFEKDGKTRKEA